MWEGHEHPLCALLIPATHSPSPGAPPSSCHRPLELARLVHSPSRSRALSTCSYHDSQLPESAHPVTLTHTPASSQRSPPLVDGRTSTGSRRRLASPSHPRRGGALPPDLVHLARPRWRRHRVAHRPGPAHHGRRGRRRPARRRVCAPSLDPAAAVAPVRLHVAPSRLGPRRLCRTPRHPVSLVDLDLDRRRRPLARRPPRARRAGPHPRVVLGGRPHPPGPARPLGGRHPDRPPLHRLPRRAPRRRALDVALARAQRRPRRPGQLAPRHPRDRARPPVVPQPPDPRHQSRRDALRRPKVARGRREPRVGGRALAARPRPRRPRRPGQGVEEGPRVRAPRRGQGRREEGRRRGGRARGRGGTGPRPVEPQGARTLLSLLLVLRTLVRSPVVD